MMREMSLLEIFLLETVGWLGIWLLNDYIAALLTLILGAIVSAVLVVAILAEAIERSRVPKKYFLVMAITIFSTALAATMYIVLQGGRMDFLEAKF